jgi:hypothetical protein
MAVMSGDKRVYSEQEVGQIIQRAAELQERAGDKAVVPYAPGVTREQLERVAHEVGVEAAFLQQALEERERPARPSGFLPVHERVVEGELDPADFDLFLQEVRGHRARNDHSKQIGRTLETRAWSGSGWAQVEVTSRNARTRLKVKPILAIEFATIPVAYLVSVFISFRVLGHAGHMGLVAPAVAGTVATAAAVSGLWIRRSGRAAGRLSDKLEGVLRRVVASQRRPEAERASQESARAERRAAATSAEDVRR